MKLLKQENKKELTEKVYDLITETNIELGYRADGKQIAALSRIFANDLLTETRFKNLYFSDVAEAFKIGVRFNEQQQFLNIGTFFKWLLQHKIKLDKAYYEVHTLNEDPKRVPFYKPHLKLLN